MGTQLTSPSPLLGSYANTSLPLRYPPSRSFDGHLFPSDILPSKREVAQWLYGAKALVDHGSRAAVSLVGRLAYSAGANSMTEVKDKLLPQGLVREEPCRSLFEAARVLARPTYLKEVT